MTAWNPRRWKTLHQLSFHRVDTWVSWCPWASPEIDWECVTCRADERDDEVGAR